MKKIVIVLLVSIAFTGCASNKTKLTNTNVTILSIKKPNGASSYSNGQAAGLGTQVGSGVDGLALGAVTGVIARLFNDANAKTESIAEITVQKLENGDKFVGRYKITPFIDRLHEGDVAKSTVDENGDLALVQAE
jgi:hypothetical protein